VNPDLERLLAGELADPAEQRALAARLNADPELRRAAARAMRLEGALVRRFRLIPVPVVRRAPVWRRPAILALAAGLLLVVALLLIAAPTDPPPAFAPVPELWTRLGERMETGAEASSWRLPGGGTASLDPGSAFALIATQPVLHLALDRGAVELDLPQEPASIIALPDFDVHALGLRARCTVEAEASVIAVLAGSPHLELRCHDSRTWLRAEAGAEVRLRPNGSWQVRDGQGWRTLRRDELALPAWRAEPRP